MLKKLAAEVYQLAMVENCQFEIANPQAKVDVNIISYTKLLIPERGDEPLENFRLVQIKNGVWEFQHKNKADNELEELELRLKAKKLYIIGRFIRYFLLLEFLTLLKL